MARGLHRLAPRQVATAKPGRHSDGGGLYLVVDKSGARRWAFMFWRDKKPTEIGLGSLVKGVSLPMARERADECRRLMAEGHDPRGWKQPEKTVPTFAALAEEVIASLESGWRNDKAPAAMALDHRHLLRTDCSQASRPDHDRRRFEGAGADLDHESRDGLEVAGTD